MRVLYSGVLVQQKSILVAVDKFYIVPVAIIIGTNFFNSIDAIKFIKEKICQLHASLIRILTKADPKFDSAVVSDYLARASIELKIISAYNPRGNAKLENMVSACKRTTVFRFVVYPPFWGVHHASN